MADLPPVELSTLGSVIKTTYDGQVSQASQAEAEAGALTEDRRWTPERVRQAAAAAGAAGTFTHAAVGALPGEAVGTTLGQGWANVKTVFGAVGNDSADDGPALQDAIDSGWPLYFPPGDYRINAPLTYNASLIMRGTIGKYVVGTPYSRIVGNFAGPLLHRQGVYINHLNAVVGTPPGGTGISLIIEDMIFRSDHADGSCIQTHNVSVPVKISRCHFQFTFRGLLMIQQFSAVVENCWFTGNVPILPRITNGTDIEAYGLYMGGHCTAIGCDFQGCPTAVYAVGSESNLLTARIEINGYGIVIGGTQLSPDNPGIITLSRSTFDGISMESNNRHIFINKPGPALELRNIAMDGGNNGPSSDGIGDYGVRIAPGGEHTAKLSNITVSGAHGYKIAPIIVEGKVTMEGVKSENSYANRPQMGGSATLFSSNTDAPWYHSRGVPLNPTINAAKPADAKLITAFSDLQLRGLKGLDIMNPNVLPSTLGRLEAATIGTTHGVTFSAAQGSGDAGIDTLTAVAGSGLAPGTYYYASTLISPRGETGIGIASGDVGGNNYKTITTTTGEVPRVTMYGLNNPLPRGKRRIYRGTVLGRFDGFYEIPTTTNVYTDTGLAFQGNDIPPPSGLGIPAEHELDASYAVVVTPSWLTTFRVISKLTTGFTIEFGTGAQAGDTIQWLLFRP